MLRRTRYLLILLLSPCVHAQSQGTSDEATYNAMVTRARVGDATVDFRAMRFLCLKIPSCFPRSTPAELTELAATRDPKTMLALCDKLLDRGFVNLEVQAVRVAAYQQMGDSISAARGFDLVTRIASSIMKGRDGKSQETAYEIITDREQMMVLSILGLPQSGPEVQEVRRLEHEGHKYVRWQGLKPPATMASPSIVVFFNVDAFVPKSVVGGK